MAIAISKTITPMATPKKARIALTLINGCDLSNLRYFKTKYLLSDFKIVLYAKIPFLGPLLPQHCLYFFPLPHGQGAFLGIFFSTTASS